MKSKLTAYVLWLLSWFGALGFHRFYLGKTGTGILWLLTGGLFMVGAIYDLFTLGRQVDQVNFDSNKSAAKKRESGIKTVFIEYEDNKGDFSDRTIEVKRLYRKNGKLYIDAYCYLQDDDRTFLVDRIIRMKTEYGGNVIDDPEGYLRQLWQPSGSKRANSLAEEALRDD